MSLLTVAVAGAALGSFLLYRSHQAQEQAQAQRDALAWADQAVLAFVTVKGRLPCPTDSLAGTESCGSGAGEGWLPVASLLANAGASGSPAPDSMAMRYLVDRGTGQENADLTAIGALYQPVFLPGDLPVDYPADLRSNLDICVRLGADAQGVAYGIAVGAQRDVVSTRTRTEVYSAARCGETGASLNALAASTTWVEAATGVQRGNVERGEINAQITTLGVTSDAFYVVDSIADLFNGVYNLMHNSANMAVASSNPALMAYIPVHAGGMSKAVAGISLAAVDTARNAGTLVIRANQLQAFRDMSQDAIAQPVWQGALDMLAIAHTVGMSAHLPDKLTAVAGAQP